MKYIIIDGMDKCGKTTISRKASKEFGANVIRFPSRRQLFEEILEGKVENQLIALHLFSADILSKIEEAVKTGGKYIFDRSFISTMAYQSEDIAVRYFDGNILKAFNYIFKSYFPNYVLEPRPEFIFILTVSPEEYKRRLEEYVKKTGKKVDVYERVETQARLYERFVLIYKYLSFWYDENRIMLIDTTNKSIDEVYKIIKDVLESIGFKGT